MTATSKPAPPAFGFLTIVEQPELGLVGGYLVVNAGGRPLEFHCTSPVKANRTQEILYGRTLRSYLCGDQIGPTLLGKAKSEPLLIVIDDPALLSIRDGIATPVVLLANQRELPELQSFEFAGHPLAIEPRYAADVERISEAWQQHAPGLDLAEPLERIRAALDEAQKSYRPAA